MADPLIDTTLGGCEVLKVIGHGGMGMIYKARQKSLDRIVAMKVLAPKLADDMNFVARFQREARAIARINHPNILAVYDVGSEKNYHYMIMELIDGESLSELQSRLKGPLKTEDASRYIRDAAQGLEAAHATGITHRDVKPENLMITKKGVIKVSDFGLAKDSDSTMATSTDAVMGTPAFMSPEQCDGKKVDGRTDIYSLGGTFFKLVTGRLPFEAETAMSMMYRHKHEALIPPKEIISALPRAISDVIVKMMAKKPSARYQDMAEVIAGIDRATKDPGVSARHAPKGAASRAGGDLDIVLPKPRLAGGGAVPPPASVSARSSAGGSSRMASMPPPGQSGRLSQGSRRGSTAVFGGRGFPPSPIPGVGSSAQIKQPGFPGGGGGQEDAFALAARGDDLLARGDRMGGLKSYREALRVGNLDGATKQRIEQEIRNEIGVRRQAGEDLLRRGLLVEAGREYRMLLELDPKDEAIQKDLKDIESKLASKRTLINDIRTAIGALQFEEAIAMWDRTPLDLRDESLGKQIEHLRNVIAPSLKLCEQGETYNSQGRLEEAIATFQDALRIDEKCERARQGLNDAEMKRNRIEGMLKEGYELHVKQEYEQAIEVWKPILRLQPGHPRVLKSIVDAYLALAREKRAQGELQAAMKIFAEAKAVDAENRGLKHAFEEVRDLADKEIALTDRAREAAERGKTGLAIRYWREVLGVNPACKSAKQQIEALSQTRQKGLFKVGAIVALILTVLACGLQYLNEYLVLSRAWNMMESQRFQGALKSLRGTWFVFQRPEVRALKRKAEVEHLLAQAQRAKMAGKQLEAADLYQAVADLLGDPNGEPFVREALKTKAGHWITKGEQAIREQHWGEARLAFEDARKVAARHPDDTDLAALDNQAVKAASFIDLLQDGLKAMKKGQTREAIARFKEALQLRPGGKYVRDILYEKLKYNPDLFKTKYREAARLLSEPWEAANLDQALKALEEARKADPARPQLAVLRQYAQDTKRCAEQGMVLYNTARPENIFDPKTPRALIWHEGSRAKAFCIDRYEFPNEKGTRPLAGLSYLRARNKCLRAGKELCTRQQWEKACRAKHFRLYTYGSNVPRDGWCNTAGKAAQPSGSFRRCHNQIGAFDMNGNLAEWVQDKNNPDEVYLVGGSFRTDARTASCSQKQSVAPNFKQLSDVGFRCCKPLK